MRIRKVTAYKYKGELFNSKKEVDRYIEVEKEQLKLEKELQEQKKLKNPLDYTISNGSFSFLLHNSSLVRKEEYRYVVIKSTKFRTAINRILKRKLIRNFEQSIDYECYILDKFGKETDLVIDLNDLPKEHEIHKYIN